MDLSRVLIALCVNLACNHFLWLVLLTYPTVSTSSFEDEYQIQQFADMADRQKNFVIDTWRIPKCWMNPSMTIDPDDHSKVVLIWRMPDKGKRDKVGYLWLNRTTMEPTKNKDMIGKKNILSNFNVIGVESV